MRVNLAFLTNLFLVLAGFHLCSHIYGMCSYIMLSGYT